MQFQFVSMRTMNKTIFFFDFITARYQFKTLKQIHDTSPSQKHVSTQHLVILCGSGRSIRNRKAVEIFLFFRKFCSFFFSFDEIKPIKKLFVRLKTLALEFHVFLSWVFDTKCVSPAFRLPFICVLYVWTIHLQTFLFAEWMLMAASFECALHSIPVNRQTDRHVENNI